MSKSSRKRKYDAEHLVAVKHYDGSITKVTYESPPPPGSGKHYKPRKRR